MPKHNSKPPPAPSPVLAAALSYARYRKYPVFPVRANRAAYFSEETTGRRWGASTEPAEITRMFQLHPRADVAIETGAVSGFWVLDLDEKNGKSGRASLEALQRQYRHHSLPSGLASTPSGGVHLFFEHPGRHVHSSTSKLGPGIDVLGDDKFVIAPPSRGRVWERHWTVRYPAPRWLVDLVCENRPQRVRAVRPLLQRSAALVASTALISPELQAMMVEDAGRGVSDAIDDMLIPDDVDLKIWCALQVIPANINYLDWFRIGAAIHGALGDDGFQHFDEWSQRSPSQYSYRECAAKWRDCAKAKRPPGPGTIYYIADQYDRGWRDAYRVMLAEEKTS